MWTPVEVGCMEYTKDVHFCVRRRLVSTKAFRASYVTDTITLHNHRERNDQTSRRLFNPRLTCLFASVACMATYVRSSMISSVFYDPCRTEYIHPWTPYVETSGNRPFHQQTSRRYRISGRHQMNQQEEERPHSSFIRIFIHSFIIRSDIPVLKIISVLVSIKFF